MLKFQKALILTKFILFGADSIIKIKMERIKGDKVIWAIVILLAIISFLAVYSSTGTLSYTYKGGNTQYYMFKHGVILLFGLLFMYFAHLIKFTYYSRIFQIALFLAIPLLIITLFFGVTLNEAKRVLPLPFGFTFQTSDLAKITLIIYLARMLSKKQKQISNFKTTFLPLIIPVIIVTGLIVKNNMSTALILFATSIVLMFIGRVKIKYLLVTLAIGAFFLSIGLSILYFMPEGQQGRLGTWQNRVKSYVNGDVNKVSNYQANQSKIAIATGGVFGKMPGNSTQRNFLPHPYSDFIYAIIIEEYGLAGGIFVLLLYLILLYRAVLIVMKTTSTFGALLTIGVAFSLVFQAMIHMGIVVGVLPVTGQPLPLVSMGGTSIWFTSLSIGIILSVSKNADAQEIDKEVERELSSDIEYA